jgi:hypothetical protein
LGTKIRQKRGKEFFPLPYLSSNNIHISKASEKQNNSLRLLTPKIGEIVFLNKRRRYMFFLRNLYDKEKGRWLCLCRGKRGIFKDLQ